MSAVLYVADRTVMMTFEITIEDPDSSTSLSIRVKAQNFREAMEKGLDELGETIDDVDAPVEGPNQEVIFVTVPGSGRQLIIKARNEGAVGPMDTTPIRRKTLEKADRLSADFEGPQDLSGPKVEANKASEAPSVPADRAQSPRLQIRSDPKAQTQRIRKPDISDALSAKSPAPPRAREARRVRMTTDQLVAAVEMGLELLDLPQRSAEEIIDATMVMVREQIPCAAIQFLLPDREPSAMRVVASRGERSGDVVLTAMDIHPRIASACVGEAAESVRVAGEEMSFAYLGRRDRTFSIEVRSALAAPLVWDGRVLGVLLCLNAPDVAGFNGSEHAAIDVLTARVQVSLQAQL